MNDLLYAEKRETTYENYEVACPYCNYWNILNRASDLKDIAPIAFKKVWCMNTECQKEFNISGDSINSVYEMLISDSYKFKSEKRYANCILNLAQSYEAFFSQYLRVEFLFKPFARERGDDSEKFNELKNKLYEYTREYAFEKMRNIFLNIVLLRSTLNNLGDSDKIFEQLKPETKNSLFDAPKNCKIERFCEKKIAGLLQKTKDSKVNILRNQVVHKHAYRPTLEEVEEALAETSATLHSLGKLLDISVDDLEWYIEKYK